jgi:hypothetical protein
MGHGDSYCGPGKMISLASPAQVSSTMTERISGCSLFIAHGVGTDIARTGVGVNVSRGG